jgi:hypothetical protein
MNRSLLRSAIAVVTALLILVAGNHWASADDPLWIYAKCTKGNLASAGNGGQDNVVVFGSAGFCLLHVSKSKFGVAIYEAGMTTTNVLSYNLRTYYVPVGKKRSFGMEVAKGRSGTFGVCLVRSPSHKIACGKIEFDHDSGYVEFTTIQPTDSLVNARITGSEAAVDPRCGACF